MYLDSLVLRVIRVVLIALINFVSSERLSAKILEIQNQTLAISRRGQKFAFGRLESPKFADKFF